MLLDHSDFSFSVFSYCEKIEHDKLHSNFLKINFHSKIKRSCFSQGQTSKYDRLAHTPRTQDRCPHRVLSSASESQKTECCSRYSASGHLQKFAADLSLSTPQNSRPCKIFTLSLNSNQNLHTPAPLNSRFSSQLFKFSFVPFNQEIVMQHFDLYSKYSILITISDSLKFLFREPRFHPDSHSSPPSLSRLKISSSHPLISHSSPWRCRTLKY